MKLVLDTNIFISAFYWGGNPQKILDRIIEGIDELYISDQILNEISAVMSRPKFKSTTEIIERYVKTIEKFGKKVFISGKIKGICRDKEDDDKIECGITSGADFLITGDDDLLILGNYQNLKILSINDYLNITKTID